MRRTAVISKLTATIVTMAALILAGCHSTPTSGLSVLSRLPNPESGQGNFMKLTAEVIVEHFGPTIRDATSVRLVSDDKNVFPYADGKVFSYYGGDPKLSISWRDTNTLLVHCDGCSPEHIFWKVTKYDFISVAYDQ